MRFGVWKAWRGEEVLTGTMEEIAAKIGEDRQAAYRYAARGKLSRDGWRVEKVAEESRARTFRAEAEDEDPIIGDAEEVAALSGLEKSYVYRLARTGGMSRSGWRIREVTA